MVDALILVGGFPNPEQQKEFKDVKESVGYDDTEVSHCENSVIASADMFDSVHQQICEKINSLLKNPLQFPILRPLSVKKATIDNSADIAKDSGAEGVVTNEQLHEQSPVSKCALMEGDEVDTLSA